MKTLTLPEALSARFETAVRRYAELSGEPVEDVRRIFELSAVQRGLASLEQDIAAGGKLATRMGWPEDKAP